MNYPKEASSLGTLSHENLVFKSMTFYSTIIVRGVYISNYVYDKKVINILSKNIPKEMSFKTDTSHPFENVNLIDMTTSKLSTEKVEQPKEDYSISLSKSDIIENFDNKINEIDKKAKQLREENIHKILNKKTKEKSRDRSITKEEDKTRDDKRAILSDYDLKELPNELLNRKVDKELFRWKVLIEKH